MICGAVRVTGKKITWSRGLFLPKGLLEKDANPQGVGNNFKASRQQQVTGDGLQRGCKSLWHLLPLTPLFSDPPRKLLARHRTHGLFGISKTTEPVSSSTTGQQREK